MRQAYMRGKHNLVQDGINDSMPYLNDRGTLMKTVIVMGTMTLASGPT